MIQTVGEFERQPDWPKNSLTFLRQLRDALADELKDACKHFHPEGEDWVEDICGQDYGESAYRRLLSRAPDHFIDELRLLRHVSRRIARIERERCGYYVGSGLREASTTVSSPLAEISG